MNIHSLKSQKREASKKLQSILKKGDRRSFMADQIKTKIKRLSKEIREIRKEKGSKK